MPEHFLENNKELILLTLGFIIFISIIQYRFTNNIIITQNNIYFLKSNKILNKGCNQIVSINVNFL